MDQDNTAKLATLRELLESGATTVNVDGVSVTIALASVRQEIRRLQAADSVQRNRRPVASRILTSGF